MASRFSLWWQHHGFLITQLFLLAAVVATLYGAWLLISAQRELVGQVRAIAERVNPPIDPATKEAADKAFANTGLSSEEIEHLIKLATDELAAKLKTDQKLQKQFDEVAKADPTAAPAEAETKARGVLPTIADAVERAGRRLGLPDGKIKELRDHVMSMPAELLIGFVKGVGSEAGKGIYRLIFGSPDKEKINVTCSCCECAGDGGEKDDDKKKGDDRKQDENKQGTQPPPAYRIIVHFALDQGTVTHETQREEIWRAREEAKGRKLHLSAFTDTTGTEKLNQLLRIRRAQNVAAALRGVGVHAEDIIVDSTSGKPLPVDVKGSEPIPGNRVVIIEFR